MNESSFWHQIKRALHRHPFLDLQRIEDRTKAGTPDVNGCHSGTEFWVELKYLDLPVRPTTPLHIKNFKPEQRLWMRNRAAAGGLSWLFVRVGELYFLFDHEKGKYLNQPQSREWWKLNATFYWEGKCDWERWLTIVTGKYLNGRK